MLGTLSRWGLVLAMAVATAAADDDAAKAFEAKALAKLKAVAEHHRKLAELAAQRGLRRDACRHLMEVLEIYPDDDKARKALGFKKGKDGWLLEAGLPKIDQVRGDERKTRQVEVAKLAAPLDKQIAAVFFGLAQDAETAKLDDLKNRYLGRALGYDREHAKARSGLGYRKNAEGQWVMADQEGRIRGAGTEPPVAEETPTKYEDALAISLNKFHTKHMWVGGYWPPKDVEDMTRHGEAAILAFHDLFKLGKFLPRVGNGQMLRQLYVKDAAAYAAFIDKYLDAEAGRKAFVKKIEFVLVDKLHLVRFAREDKDGERERRDRVVYLVGNSLAHALCREAPPWIAEGVAWGLTLRMLGTKMNWSIGMADTTTDYGAKNWNDHSSWRAYLREMVLLGDPPHPSSVLVTRDWNSISAEKAAYAWSMVEFLWSTRPEKFVAFGEAIAKERDKVEEACQSSFGLSMEELDAAWRQWVKWNY